MGTIDTIRGILKDLITADMLREKVVLLEKEINTIMDRNAYLEKETANLIRKNENFKNELAELQRLQHEFIEYKGAYFKRLPGGNGYSEGVYCVHCQSPMWAQDLFHYECSRCGHIANFSKNELPKILEELKNI